MSTPPPRIELRRISITNFRGIDHLEIEFPPGDDRAGAMVLAGDNGVGKTSVLEAILILFGRIDLLPADTARPKDLVRQGATDFRIEGTYERGGKARKGNKWHVDRQQLEKLDQRLRLPGAASSIGLPTAKASLDAALASLRWGGVAPSHFAIDFFPARRDPYDLGAPVMDTSGQRPSLLGGRLLEIKRRLVYEYARSGADSDAFRRIQSFVQMILGNQWSLDVVFQNGEPGSEPLVVLRDGVLPSEARSLDALRERAAYGEPVPQVIPIDRLSSGQIAVLALTYPFVFADRVPDLVLLDEPEQHLHVTWQKTLLYALRTLSPMTQFVLTTHSPWILDSVPSYERCEIVSDIDPRIAARAGTAA